MHTWNPNLHVTSIKAKIRKVHDSLQALMHTVLNLITYIYMESKPLCNIYKDLKFEVHDPVVFANQS